MFFFPPASVFHRVLSRRNKSASEGERGPGRAHGALDALHTVYALCALYAPRETGLERMTIFDRRMLTRGVSARLAGIEIADLDEVPWPRPRHTEYAAHAVYPDARWYTVRRMSARIKTRVRCGCPNVTFFDQDTGEAEVLCGCPLGEQIVSEYPGEYSDTRRLLMEHDLCTPGSLRTRKRAAAARTAETPAAARTAEAAPAAPLQTEAAPLQTEAAPLQTEAAPAAPLQTEAAPLQTGAAPLQTEAAPLQTEAAPAPARAKLARRAEAAPAAACKRTCTAKLCAAARGPGVYLAC